MLSALIGTATSVWQVGVLRATGWSARGLRVPARNALLADVVPSAYGRAYGFERAMDNLGAIVGPLLALGLVSVFTFRETILLSVIPGLLAAVAIVYAIRAAPRLAKRERQKIRLRVRPVMVGPLGRFLCGVAAFELGNVAATLLILRATDLLTPGHGSDDAPDRAPAVRHLQPRRDRRELPGGHLGDRRGGPLVVALGVVAFGIAFVGLAFAGASIALLAVMFAAAGIGIGCAETAQHAAVASLAPTNLRGSAFGLLAAVQSFGNLAASAIAGVLGRVSPRAAFLYLGAWMIVALVLLARARLLSTETATQ